jgi:hypothetical protein
VRSRAGRITVRVTVAAIVVGGAALGATVTSSAASAATTLVVDANQPFRTVTHVASGGLYGLDTASVPADSLVEPLHPNTFVQMAPGGKQLPNGESAPGGDALVVAWDMPFVTRDVLGYIQSKLAAPVFAAVPEVSGRVEPLCAAYSARCLDVIARQLEEDDLRLHALVDRLPVVRRLG